MIGGALAEKPVCQLRGVCIAVHFAFLFGISHPMDPLAAAQQLFNDGLTPVSEKLRNHRNSLLNYH